MKGPSAIAFIKGDPVEAAKGLRDFAKANPLLVIKGGYMDGRTLSRTDLVIAGMIVIGVAGFVTDRLIVLLNNRLLRWSPQHHV